MRGGAVRGAAPCAALAPLVPLAAQAGAGLGQQWVRLRLGAAPGRGALRVAAGAARLADDAGFRAQELGASSHARHVVGFAGPALDGDVRVLVVLLRLIAQSGFCFEIVYLDRYSSRPQRELLCTDLHCGKHAFFRGSR